MGKSDLIYFTEFISYSVFYYPTYDVYGYVSLDAAVLDLVADDGSGIQKQKARMHWDKVFLNFLT